MVHSHPGTSGPTSRDHTEDLKPFKRVYILALMRLSDRLQPSVEAFSDTIPLDPSYRQVVMRLGRQYQRHALENGVYFVPVDEVRATRFAAQLET